jgi:SAM-dependent methyltransferase
MTSPSPVLADTSTIMPHWQGKRKMSGSVKDHYGKRSSPEIIKQFFDRARERNYQFTSQDLAAFDQFHIGGLVATEHLADMLKVEAGERILDVGSGIGGPARYLEKRFGAQVVGIDITPEYQAIAGELNELTGSTVRFITGDALCTGLPTAAFDLIWSQHVAMNIDNRAQLYFEFARLLRPGGQLAIYDVLKANEETIDYPVPWSFDGQDSFLTTEEETISLISRSGFTLLKNENVTQQAIDWLAMGRTKAAAVPALSDIMGPGFKAAALNLAGQLKAGKLSVAQMLFKRL